MKKKVNILLIIAVLLLWGGVIYKVLSNYLIKGEGDKTMERHAGGNIRIVEKDTFTLSPLRRDPFLNRSLKSREEIPNGRRQSVSKLLNSPKAPEAIKGKVPFPTIQYYGFIKSKEKKQELILLKVDGRLKKMHLNESIEGFAIRKVFRDSVIISNKSQTKTILKEK